MLEFTGKAVVKKNYVLIDYENVQPQEMAALEREHFNVIIFVGANQAKVTFEVASVLQRMGDQAAYVKISGNGNNALDFHIAYYIGQLATKEPDAYFHIISKDAGFDPLIQHLKSKKIFSGRCNTVSDIPILKLKSAHTPLERIAAVIENLKHRGASKPRTVKTLSSTINALFSKALTEAEVGHIVSELERTGIVQVNQTKVVYKLMDEL
jgi:hypothetical protein